MSSQFDASAVLFLKGLSVPTEWETLWAPEQVSTFQRKQKFLISVGNRVRIPRTFSVWPNLSTDQVIRASSQIKVAKNYKE